MDNEKILLLVEQLKAEQQSIRDQANGAIQALGGVIARLEAMLPKPDKPK